MDKIKIEKAKFEEEIKLARAHVSLEERYCNLIVEDDWDVYK